MNHQSIWQKHASTITVDDIVRAYQSPATFQRDFSRLINEICRHEHYTSTIEVGCETGVTSLLLADNLQKTFLDLNCDIIKKVESACKRLGVNADFLTEDMFAMESIPDESYDVVFNSGVLEHFGEDMRAKALTEYSRILKRKGRILIGIPNHYSFPYRSAYILRKRILRGLGWPWPPEHKIFDMQKEIATAGLQIESRVTLAKETAFNFWNRLPLARQLLKKADKLFKYEGYLTVITIKKPETPTAPNPG